MRIPAGTGGAATFDATERLAIATGNVTPEPNTVPHLLVQFLTAEQARVAFPCASVQVFPWTGTVSGIVRGGDPAGFVEIAHGGRSGYTVYRLDSAFTLGAFDGAGDLIATRFPYERLDHVDRAIVRRAQRYPAGSSIALDFAASEAFTLASHTISWTGPSAHVQVNFHTAQGTNNVLQSSIVGPNLAGDIPRSGTVHSIPAAHTMPGDLHQLAISGDRRSVDVYYREPADRAVTFGPLVGAPTFATVAVAPYVRVRMTLPSQPEYGSSASVFLRQDPPPGTDGHRSRVSLFATREHFGGTPRTWTLELPDLSRVDGFRDVFGLRPGRYTWGITVSSRPFWFSPAQAVDGTIVRDAWLGGEVP